MNWEIHYNLWDNNEHNKTIALVIDQIALEFERLIPTGPPLGYKPIYLVNDMYYEKRLYLPLETDKYKIGLQTEFDTFEKATYQFAHELCHIYCDPRSISWLSEIICHVASFYFLDLFGEKWEINAPDKKYEGYYEHFRNLKKDKLREIVEKVDLVQNQVSNTWIKEEVRKIRRSKDYRNPVIYNIIALELVPQFKESTDPWALLPFIGQCHISTPSEDVTDLSANRDVIPDFDKLYRIVPSHLKPVVNSWKDTIWIG